MARSDRLSELGDEPQLAGLCVLELWASMPLAGDSLAARRHTLATVERGTGLSRSPVARGLLPHPGADVRASHLVKDGRGLDKEEFLHRVMELTSLHDRTEAKRATRAALAVLRDAIPAKEAHDLGSQLPKEFRDFMWSPKGKWTPPERLDMESLVNHVRSVLAAENREQAEQVTRGIFAVLKEAVSPGELEHVVGVLPPELQPILATS